MDEPGGARPCPDNITEAAVSMVKFSTYCGYLSTEMTEARVSVCL